MINRYYRAKNSGALIDCTISLASGEKMRWSAVTPQNGPKPCAAMEWSDPPRREFLATRSAARASNDRSIRLASAQVDHLPARTETGESVIIRMLTASSDYAWR